MVKKVSGHRDLICTHKGQNVEKKLTTASLQKFVLGLIIETWGEGKVAKLLIEPTTNCLVVVYDRDNDPLNTEICVIGLTFARIYISKGAVSIMSIGRTTKDDRHVILFPPP